MDSRENTQQSDAVLEPGVISSYGNARKQLLKYFLEIFLIFIIFGVIGIPLWVTSWTGYSIEAYTFWHFFGIGYSILVMGPLSYGVAFACLKAARDKAPEVNNIFEAFKTYWNAVLAGLLVSVIVAIGFILLVVPSIIFACKLAFVPFLVMDRKMEAVAAVKESWKMTHGYAPDVFYIGLLGILILIAGAICFGVGIIISFMWISLAIASLYHAVSLKQQASPQDTA
ncbi:hypothetical protein ACFLYN_02225 [Chloroflexota bacterium]